MAQIASAYPTAGGLYHWSSILGGRGWGWGTAWLNLLGLVTVLSAINVGTFLFAVGAFKIGVSTVQIVGDFALSPTQLILLVVLTSIQAAINHFGIRVTTMLTDFSGYLIFFLAGLLTISLLVYAPTRDISRLWTFTNFSGPVGGDVWPATTMLGVFLLGLLLPIYTITGFDACAHVSEETVNAQRSVPRSIISSVLYSSLFGWIMLCAFVIAIPDMATAAKQGYNVFFYVLEAILPQPLRLTIYVLIFISQFLCGLATVTSASRMIFAFARDGGFPSFLREISPRFRTPVAAIWAAAIISILFTLYAPVYSTIVTITVIFLFLSYAMPIAAGLFTYGRTWTKMGPWNIGGAFRVVSVAVIVAIVFIFGIGIQPPNDKALWVTAAFFALLTVIWFAFERNRFMGPPTGESIAQRQAEIAATERGIGD